MPKILKERHRVHDPLQSFSCLKKKIVQFLSFFFNFLTKLCEILKIIKWVRCIKQHYTNKGHKPAKKRNFFEKNGRVNVETAVEKRKRIKRQSWSKGNVQRGLQWCWRSPPWLSWKSKSSQLLSELSPFASPNSPTLSLLSSQSHTEKIRRRRSFFNKISIPSLSLSRTQKRYAQQRGGKFE